jgi:hypothetical protein
MGTSNNSSYATESTPIPLGMTPGAANYSVTIPGVASWNNGANAIQVYSDASGNVSLTLQAGGVSYPTQYTSSATANPNNVAVAPSTSSGSNPVKFWSDTVANNGTIPLYIGENAPVGITDAASFTLQGLLGWAGNGLTVAPVANPVISTSGYINAGNESNFTVAGTGVAGDTVSVTLSKGGITTAAKTVTIAAGSTTWTIPGFDASGFTDGTVTINATQTAPAGGTPGTATTTVTKDTVAPQVATADASSTASSLVLNSAGETDWATVTVTGGTAVSAVAGTVSGGNADTITGMTATNGQTVIFTITDAAGNTTSETATWNGTVWTIA